MFYLTGDTHGDFRRVARFCKQHALTASDTVIVLGDAGINYFCNDRDLGPRRLLSKAPATIFCIHGNHERRPQTLAVYREDTWKGGTVFIEDEYPNILFAKDGEVYDLDGIKAIAIGGAYSVDKYWRLERGWSWFADEQPDEMIMARVDARLNQLDWRIDIVLSHTCPRKYEPVEVFLEGLDQSTVDKSTELWLDIVEDRLEYKRWYCGHYHTSKRIDKLQFMYEDFDVLHTSNSTELALVQPDDQPSSRILYTADLHLGHDNIIKFCNRPFADVDEMNRAIINNWNARVRDIDHVYIVGDLAYRSACSVASYLEQMRGFKHLVIGNHERSWIKQIDLKRHFESVSEIKEIKDNGQRVVLCHYPLITWPGRDSYMVYGHIHNNRKGEYWPQLRNMTRALNAGVEINGFQPVTLRELIDNNTVFRSGQGYV
jgi:3-oxoacid CoA-transferase subunit A